MFCRIKTNTIDSEISDLSDDQLDCLIEHIEHVKKDRDVITIDKVIAGRDIGNDSDRRILEREYNQLISRGLNAYDNNNSGVWNALSQKRKAFINTPIGYAIDRS